MEKFPIRGIPGFLKRARLSLLYVLDDWRLPLRVEFYFQTHFDKGSSRVCFPFFVFSPPSTFESNKKALF
jgi:hypothetical protein